MKLLLRPTFAGPDKGEGGIRRWVEAQEKHLPEHGIELVERETEADIVACHAGDLVDTGKPLVAHCHGLYNTASQEWSRWAWMLNSHVIEVLRRARLVTVPSRWVAHQLARGMSINAHVLYAGIEPNLWTPGKNEGYILWNKTRTDPVCDPTPMDRLAAANPTMKFVSTFGQKASNVKLTGKIPFEEARELLCHAAVYLSSPRETFGISTVEAMACEVPVLGWAWGGNLDIVRHGETGYLATPGDYEDLQRGVEFCLEHRAELGQAARQDALRYTWQRAVAEVAGLYRQVWDPASQPHPKVSVVVTCFNLEDFLPECIASLKAQTYGDWEALIIDDCSPGPCREVTEACAVGDPRIRYLRTPRNLYLAGARNWGIRQALGDYILPLDADDMLNPRALEVLAGHLDKQPGHAIAYGKMEVLEPDGKRWVSGWPRQFSWEQQMEHRNQLPYGSMYRRLVWERTGGYRERCQTAEDADFWCRVTSAGFRAFRATDYPFLVKRQRPQSMGHTESEPDWTAWYPWARNRKVTPFGAVGTPPGGISWPVRIYDKPEVAVIIPVGPGHAQMVRDALDSVMAQTFRAWECVVVNDSGEDLDLSGFPWAKLVTTPNHGSGPAVARNLGIGASSAPAFVCLDADDYLMPTFLERTMAVQREHGGYVYTDWFQIGPEGHERKESRDFIAGDLLELGLSFTVTSVIPRAAWDEAGGFDPQAGGWEDWDFFFHVTTKGYCGTRVPEPLLAYRYWSGQRRENGYATAQQNARTLRRKWRPFIEKGGRKFMGCAGCGKGGGKGTSPSGMAARSNPGVAQATQQGGTLLLEYTGASMGTRQYRGQVTGQTYRFGDNASHRRMFVFAADAEFLLRRQDFRVVTAEQPKAPPPPTPEEPLQVRQEGRMHGEGGGSLPETPTPSPEKPVRAVQEKKQGDSPAKPARKPVAKRPRSQPSRGARAAA